jgi:two-component system, cell cycle response regulator CtrA
MNSSTTLECPDPKTGASAVQTGKLTVNLDRRVVTVDGNPVHLTGKEYEVLELLSLRKGKILTKEMFFDRLYGGRNEPEYKIFDVFVCRLRKKLALATGGSHYIETVWGRGYVLRDPAIRTGTTARGIDRERAGNGI